ncbi:hypothetical protein BCV72DRAFT_325471 [Rhizopus microsporus var. microsporus]|uniref:Uncharacterized protein n=1 Tax=Rhizopus microsporus var. microsporus TaxID=86635 RepID=A0A1X0QLX0_RHIZD|nr:hypothetical protein BCV72DRAFT_325471 [Rhizopus microsporus var. microsporus]
MLFTLIGKYIHTMPTLKQPQAEFSAAKAAIVRLQQQNASLRERLAQVFSATILPAANPSAVTRPPESPWQHQPSRKRPSTPDTGLPPSTKVATKLLAKLSCCCSYI